MTEMTLRRWADRRYGEDAPHDNTLRNWAKTGKIYPLPRKQGRAYFVREDAVYLSPGEAPPDELTPAPKGRLARILMNEQRKAS
jgi:hypothetical protein